MSDSHDRDKKDIGGTWLDTISQTIWTSFWIGTHVFTDYYESQIYQKRRMDFFPKKALIFFLNETKTTVQIYEIIAPFHFFRSRITFFHKLFSCTDISCNVLAELYLSSHLFSELNNCMNVLLSRDKPFVFRTLFASL